VKRILKPVTYVLAQADLGLACQARRADAIARLDPIVAALPLAGAVFGTGDHTGTGQTGGGLFGCYRSDGKQRCDIDRRRASKARAGRAPVHPYPGQADENPSFCLGVHKILRSQGMAGSQRGLASHSRNKQGHPPVSNQDEKLCCGGITAVLKTAVGEGGP
jgi:hypothetical protein